MTDYRPGFLQIYGRLLVTLATLGQEKHDNCHFRKQSGKLAAELRCWCAHHLRRGKLQLM